MATKTSNYEFNKPEQNDFYDVDVQNENWDKVDEELSEFDDSGVTEDIKSFPDFLSKFVTGNKVAITLRNLKAGLQFVLHAGQIVNNCVTDNTGLPLSAAQGKVLKDLIDTTNNNLSNLFILKDYPFDSIMYVDNTVHGFYSCGPNLKNLPVSTYGMALVCQNQPSKWIFIIFIPTSADTIYVNFYNGYSGDSAGWTGWNSVPLSKKQ